MCAGNTSRSSSLRVFEFHFDTLIREYCSFVSLTAWLYVLVSPLTKELNNN